MKRFLNILKFFQVLKRQLAGSAFKNHSGTSYNNAYITNGSIIKFSFHVCMLFSFKMVYLNACNTGINNLSLPIKDEIY
jgi:hypothetical protein